MQTNSTYNKVKEIISTARTHPAEINSFSERLQANENSFIYYKREGEVTIKAPCSIESIKRNVIFCIDIGLLNNSEDCSLTEDGIEGVNPENFDNILRMALLAYLENKDVSWELIEKAIDELDYASPNSIYDYINPQISEEEFRKCLFLLSLCGSTRNENILHGYTKKTYLTDKKINEIWNE